MKTRFAALLFISATLASAQGPKLPADVDPVSYSRLPLLTRDKMTPEQTRVMDRIAGKDRATPPLGPQTVSYTHLTLPTKRIV